MATRYTTEGQERGGVPVDENGNRIPRDQLNWVDENNRPIDYYDENGKTNLTYDHENSCADMWNDGAEVTNPQTGETTTYPLAGHDAIGAQ